MIFITKIFFAALVIAFSSWLAGQYPKLAGFILALPIASLLAIVFSYMEYNDPEKSVTFAKSILIGVPATYFFFLPFYFGNHVIKKYLRTIRKVFIALHIKILEG